MVRTAFPQFGLVAEEVKARSNGPGFSGQPANCPIRRSNAGPARKKPRHRAFILIRVADMNRNIFYIIGVIVVIVIVLKLLGVF